MPTWGLASSGDTGNPNLWTIWRFIRNRPISFLFILPDISFVNKSGFRIIIVNSFQHLSNTKRGHWALTCKHKKTQINYTTSANWIALTTYRIWTDQKWGKLLTEYSWFYLQQCWQHNTITQTQISIRFDSNQTVDFAALRNRSQYMM